MLHVDAVRKSYGDTLALDNVSLSVGRGEIVGLVGPNGAGKTTLVEIVCGLLTPDQGAVHISGGDVTASACAAAEQIAYAAQRMAFYPPRRVVDNLRHFGRLTGLDRRELAARLSDVIERLSLGEFLERRAYELSGGQQRRLHIAIALMKNAPILVLDEPTAGVDISTRRDLVALIRELADAGTGVLYSTHYLVEIEEFDDRVVMLNRGRTLAAGTVKELVRSRGGMTVEAIFDEPPTLIELPGATTTADGNALRFAQTSEQPIMEAVLDALRQQPLRVESVRQVRPSLESLYFELAGLEAT